MFAEIDPQEINDRINRDKLAHFFLWLLIVLITADYVLSDHLNQGSSYLFYILPSLTALQSISRFIPVIKNWRWLNSGSLPILIMFNIHVAALYMYYIPLQSSYHLIWGLVTFYTVYWLRLKGFLFTLVLQAVTLLFAASNNQTDLYGGDLYYVAIIFLTNIVLGGVVLRVSEADKRIQNEFVGVSKKVYFERDRLLSLINSTADAVIATDLSGKVVLYNGAALNLLNTNMNLVGSVFDDILQLRDKEGKPFNVIAEMRDHPTVLKHDDLHFTSNEEQQVDVYISVASIHSYGEEEKSSGYIILLRDITKEKTLDEQRDEFISVVTHELRTPVAVAEASVSSVLYNKMSPLIGRQSELIKKAHENIIFLADLVNDLAMLTRIERERLDVNIVTLSPYKLLRQLVSDYHAEAIKKGINLVVSRETTTKEINTSELHLTEILQNFINNAIKYTPTAGEVIIKAVDSDKGVVFSVKDNGIGISSTDQKKLFTKFFRSEDFRTKHVKGTGLGLYIASRLADRIHAKIWLESKLGQGSTFYVKVPTVNINVSGKSDFAKSLQEEIKRFAETV